MTTSEPRVFVGTMYAGEGGFEKCLDAIESQTGVAITHSVITGLNEKDAHNSLWELWRNAKADGFDMFVKVDADTELAHNEVALEFWRMMQANSRITGIQAPLLDYFTDGYINGLNCFSPKVTFRDTTSDLFCDRQVDVDHDVVVKASGVVERLRPAGYHCYQTTNAQAFHFGLHRAMKGQTMVIDLVKQAYHRHGDRNRAMALLGAQCAGTFSDGCFNYTDERFKQALDVTLGRFDELVKSL